MKILLLSCCCIAMNFAWSQQTVDVSKTDYRVGQSTFFSVGGEPFVNVKFVSLVEGSPYFSDEWMQGVIVSRDGQAYKDISLRLDLIDNQLHYLDPNGKEFLSTTPLREVVLIRTPKDSLHFLYSSYLPSSSLLPQGWYQRLATGHATLYTYYKKTVEENRPYGSAALERSIKTQNVFIMETAQGMTEVKKLKDLPDVLNDKKAELENFLSTRDDRKATPEARFTAAVNYYNSL